MAGVIDVAVHPPSYLRAACYKCTCVERIPAQDDAAGYRVAHAIGWREDARGLVCPKCPGGARGCTVDQALMQEELLRRAIQNGPHHLPEA